MAFAASLQAQGSVRTLPGSSGTSSREQTVISEVQTALNAIRKESESQAVEPKVLTETEYLTMKERADRFMLEEKYGDAIRVYQEILVYQDDSYAKDRILEAQALQAKQQQKEAQLKKDQELRSQAEAFSTDRAIRQMVHFTGALMSDVSSDFDWTTEAFNTLDVHSDFLKPGKYNDLRESLKTATGYSLDGIAIPENMRLIVYSKPDCTGRVLLDVTGPAIVNNGYRYQSRQFKHLNEKQFHDKLQASFPQSVRSWSSTNMHGWTKGSLEIRMEKHD
jgi:hypothetical protein